MSDARSDNQPQTATDWTGPRTGEVRSDASGALLVFRLDQLWYAASASSVTKVLAWTEPVPVPGAPAFVKGVVNNDGQILAVFDLAALLGCGQSRSEVRREAQRCLVLQAGNNQAVAAVDEIFGLAEVAASEMQDHRGEGAVAQTFTFRERTVSVLSVPRLLSSVLGGAGRE